MNPSRNHIAEESLSESANALNMRKLLVNAQITAVISSIEMLFFAIHIIGVSAAGGTNSVTPIIVMVMYMILFMIILPYAFLMNTSYNKNRIIENGFVNVIRNMTTNNSILGSNILNACYKDESNENAGNELFVVRGHFNREISTENIPSIGQASPSPMCSETPLQNNAVNEERKITAENKSAITTLHDTNTSSRERPR